MLQSLTKVAQEGDQDLNPDWKLVLHQAMWGGRWVLPSFPFLYTQPLEAAICSLGGKNFKKFKGEVLF